jgi:hypothetical protein
LPAAARPAGARAFAEPARVVGGQPNLDDGRASLDGTDDAHETTFCELRAVALGALVHLAVALERKVAVHCSSVQERLQSRSARYCLAQERVSRSRLDARVLGTRAGCLVDGRLASAWPRRSECTISAAMPLAGMRERW